MSMIGCLVVDAGVQALVVVIVKIVGDAGPGVGQVGENGPLAEFEHLRFESGPQAFDLGIIVAVAAPALRAHGSVLVQQLPIRVAAVLPAAVRMHQQAQRRRLGPKSPLQGPGDQFFRHGRPDLPADYVLAGHVLKGAPVGLVAVGQRQIRAIADPDPVRLGRLGLVNQPVWRAPQPVGGIGRARGERLGRQGPQAPAAHGRAQALAADAMAFSAQGNLQSARTTAVFVVAECLHQRGFPSRLTLCCALLLSVLPRVIPAGRYA